MAGMKSGSELGAFRKMSEPLPPSPRACSPRSEHEPVSDKSDKALARKISEEEGVLKGAKESRLSPREGSPKTIHGSSSEKTKLREKQEFLKWMEGSRESSEEVIEKPGLNQHHRGKVKREDTQPTIVISDPTEKPPSTKLQPWVVERAEISLTSTVLGSGGWGEVVLANFRGTEVAAKVLHNVIASPYNIALFAREMGIAAQVHHPNIVQFLGATNEGEAIILTELMPTSLRRVLEKRALERHSLSHVETVSIGLDVTRALNYLHLMKPSPIIHRDISSANILLEPTVGNAWRAKVSDFGSANFLHQLKTVGPGAPLYAPPEASNPSLQSPKMDVYSFGVLLLEMCLCEMIDKDGRPAAVRRVKRPALRRLIAHCLAEEPQRRPDIEAVLRTLQTET